MILLDANVFIAFENKEDVHHQRAQEIFEGIDAGKLGKAFTTDYVFNEVIGVIYRKRGKERATAFGDYMRASVCIFVVDEHILSESWDFFKKTKLTLNFVDCTIVTVAGITNAISIATFDKEFSKVENINVTI